MSLASLLVTGFQRVATEIKTVRSEAVTKDPVRSATKIKCYTYDPMIAGNVAGIAITSGVIYLHKMPLLSLDPLTGMIVPIATQGVYTAAATGNRVGLYRSDGTTLTLVAATAEDGNLWKGVSGSNADKAFATPYTPGSITEHIYGAYLYRNTAQTTAPAILRLQTAASLIDIGATGGQHRAGTLAGQTDLPASVLVSSFGFGGSPGQQLFWMGVY